MNRVVLITNLALMLVLLSQGAGCSRSQRIDPAPDIKAAMVLRAGGGGDATHAVAQSTGTGWGTLKGRFVFNGTPPELAPLPTGKDVEVCGSQVPNQALLVDPSSKGIADVAIYARKAPRVFQPAEGAAPEEPAVFDQKKCIFLSHVFATQVKNVLEIKNSDPVAHNTSFSPGGVNQPINPQLQPNAQATYKFAGPMAFPAQASCSIHPWMKAYIIARDDPYYAVTKPDGSFEIKNVPAGEDVEFQVWHERAATGLEAKPEWSKGRFKIKVPAEGELDLGTIEVPASAFH